jgi:thiol-disulfide isomerase/thioredoxin
MAKRLMRSVILTVSAVGFLVGAKQPLPVVGEMAPAFELTLIDGTKVKSQDLRGKVVILNFWATWCVPCRTELPTLDRYYELRKANGLRVYAITTEGSLPLWQLKDLFANMGVPSVRRIRGPFGVLEGLPTNFVIDRSGRLRYAEANAFDLDSLNKILVPLLREPVPPASGI